MGYIGGVWFNSYDIWMDGFVMNGTREGPQLLASDVLGQNFKEACFCSYGLRVDYDEDSNTLFGCKLHENKEDCFDPTS